jgi:hypothetical protein
MGMTFWCFYRAVVWTGREEVRRTKSVVFPYPCNDEAEDPEISSL